MSKKQYYIPFSIVPRYNHYHSQPPLLQKAIKDTMTLKFLKQHAN